MAQNYGLGRGLSSLIPSKKSNNKKDEDKDELNYFGAVKNASAPGFSSVASAMEEKTKPAASVGGEAVQQIEVSKVVPNPFQPRADFDENKLYELAQSIKEHGIIQPIVVSQSGAGFEIIAGERRFQAAKIAGLQKIPAIVKNSGTDQKKLELAVVENVQRENLSPIEEAKSYKRLAEEFSLTQEAIAKKMGKSRSVVANKMRLLDLPEDMQSSLVAGKITEGHAKLLLAIPDKEKQKNFFDLILKNGLTVRQTEEKTKEVSVRPHKRQMKVDPEIKSIEDNLTQTLGTKVKIKKSGTGGRIEIEYYSQEELNGILEKIK